MRKTATVFTGMAALAVALCTGVLTCDAAPASGPSGYHVVKTIPVGTAGGWDYLVVDADARRVYISHATHVIVLDADTHAVVGDIPDTQGVHGIALAPELGRGYTSNGRANTATIFDLKTLKTLATVKTGANPDAIIYDSVSKRVFTLNGRSKDATAFSAADGTLAGTLALGGKPEFAVVDGKGSIFVNIEDTAELVQFDAQKLTVLHRWPLKPCAEPTGLSIDVASHRLFAGCDNKMVAVVNADTGVVIATPAAGEGIDATAFEPATGLIFASNGEDGTLTVIHEDSPDKFTVLDTVPTKKSARTFALDPKTHNIFLPAAELDPPGPGEQYRRVRPGTFVILVVAKK